LNNQPNSRWQPTGVKLGSPWPKLGRPRANLGLACAERLNATNPNQSHKTLQSNVSRGVSHRLGRAWARTAPDKDPSCVMLAQLDAKMESCWAEVGPKSIQMDPKWKPCDARGCPSHVQHGAVWPPLATASHQVGPNGDTTWETLLNMKRHQYKKRWKIENACCDAFVLGRPCSAC